MKVSTSILTEMKNYKEVIKKLNDTSSDFIHLDIMDSTFTESSSFDIENLRNINELTNKKLDVHLMSTNLDKLIEEYSTINPEFITFHVETENILKHINMIKKKNIKVGLAVNPKTDIEEVYPYLELVDLILIMSVTPGKGGQKFMPEVVCKLQELKEIKPNYNYVIEVDGGINNDIINYVKNYVDIVVSGSFITNSTNYEDKIKLLK